MNDLKLTLAGFARVSPNRVPATISAVLLNSAVGVAPVQSGDPFGTVSGIPSPR
jgi:hypothetical protein